jgi:hypothetical protein
MEKALTATSRKIPSPIAIALRMFFNPYAMILQLNFVVVVAFAKR